MEKLWAAAEKLWAAVEKLWAAAEKLWAAVEKLSEQTLESGFYHGEWRQSQRKNNKHSLSNKSLALGKTLKI